jgi:hypothetical protein
VPRRKSAPTPEEVLDTIIAQGQDFHWQSQLWRLLLTVPNPIGKRIMDVIANDHHIIKYLESQVEKRQKYNKRTLSLRPRMKWARIAHALKITEDAAKKEHKRALKAKGQTGIYAASPRGLK